MSVKTLVKTRELLPYRSYGDGRYGDPEPKAPDPATSRVCLLLINKARAKDKTYI